MCRLAPCYMPLQVPAARHPRPAHLSMLRCLPATTSEIVMLDSLGSERTTACSGNASRGGSVAAGGRGGGRWRQVW